MKLTELSIFTDAVTETAAFYQKLLGCAPVQQEAGFALFQTADFQIVVHRKRQSGDGDVPSESHAGFSVAHLDATIHALEASGVVVEFSPKTYPWGRSAYLRDPAGNLIELNDDSQSH